MQKTQSFIKKSLLGGLVVVLPIVVLLFFFRWLYELVTDLLEPISNLLIKTWGFPALAADLLTLLIILLSCFLIGTIVSTSIGKWLHERFDGTLARLAPGYRMIKEIVQQFFGNKEDSPFAGGKVALAQLFGADNPTQVTALVTSEHPDGSYTVFVPTGPNPTSGMIYHLPGNQVKIYPKIQVDSAMRTVISCGAGTGELFGIQPETNDAARKKTLDEASIENNNENKN